MWRPALIDQDDATSCGRIPVLAVRRERGASAPRIPAIKTVGFSPGCSIATHQWESCCELFSRSTRSREVLKGHNFTVCGRTNSDRQEVSGHDFSRAVNT